MEIAKAIVEKIEKREVRMDTNTKKSIDQVHEEMIAAGEERKSVKEERVSEAVKRATKEEEERTKMINLMEVSTQELKEARVQEEKRDKEFLGLLTMLIQQQKECVDAMKSLM
eukprot:TRINITY_DN1474_c0_g1_i1.p2 TRINITY_DN1474_c0_g1~~TRINITY_DN1474_c0_g1_i1.p2  ORF type:complete len:113 (+),score=44.39 TRINITY_DN1474_c0_g1_i1:296-634(+)